MDLREYLLEKYYKRKLYCYKMYNINMNLLVIKLNVFI